jgi:hypothetical protein
MKGLRHHAVRLKSVFVMLFGAWTLVSCQAEKGPPPKVVVVFVDVSASVKDFDVYHDAWKKIVDRLTAGDRVLLGRITHETFTQFRPLVDESLPTFSWISDNSRDYDKKLKQTKERLSKVIDESLKAPRSQKTDILNTSALADKIFHGDKRRAVLVLLSDMLEDSDAHNFEKVKVDETFARRVIEEKHRKGEMPDLKGATIYVAGASAKNAAKALEVQRFWLGYFKAANGNLSPQNYGPALINFDE